MFVLQGTCKLSGPSHTEEADSLQKGESNATISFANGPDHKEGQVCCCLLTIFLQVIKVSQKEHFFANQPNNPDHPHEPASCKKESLMRKYGYFGSWKKNGFSRLRSIAFFDFAKMRCKSLTHYKKMRQNIFQYFCETPYSIL